MSFTFTKMADAAEKRELESDGEDDSKRARVEASEEVPTQEAIQEQVATTEEAAEVRKAHIRSHYY